MPGEYYREKSTGFFIRVEMSKPIHSERITTNCKIYKARIFDESTNQIESQALVSDTYLRDKCVYWMSQYVPREVRDKLVWNL